MKNEMLVYLLTTRNSFLLLLEILLKLPEIFKG